MHLFNRINNNLKYLLVIVVLFWFFLWGISNAEDDLLRNVMEPAYLHDTTVRFGRNSKTVWNTFFGGATTVDITAEEWVEISNEPSTIVKLTRYFLKFTIAISVTMILYNGLTYIIKTGKWEEWKNLVSNVIYIVVWILIALFSVIIITILQSAWTTINKTVSLNQHSNIENVVHNMNYKSLLW